MDLINNRIIQDYVNKVCAQVKFRDVHPDVKLELEAHIQEIIEEHLAQGFSEKEAAEKAVVQMGDADMVGKQLNKVHKPKPEWSILLISLLFINTGLLSLYFIQKQSLLSHNIPIFERSLLFSLISFIIMIGFYFFSYKKLERYSKHIYLGTLALLTYTVLFGIQYNGSSSWLTLGSLSLNVVAVSPILFIIALAGIFNKWDWDNTFNFLQGVALCAVPLILMLGAPSISSSVIYAVASMVLMVASGAKLKRLLFISVPFIAMIILSVFTVPYRIDRLLIFLNPGSDPHGSGYINTQLNKIIEDAGLFGQGLTFAPQGLPDLHTDFIFSFITYTFGWIAGILLIALTVLFLVRIARITRIVKNNYAKLLISGFVSILTVEFLWNILMNLGLAPISGIGLPFISYGGSQLIINAVIVGMISSIFKRRNVSQNCQ
ncbi:FtsW/RodA/SpoVE family cell cycle protein [Dehalobacterium formicoaceticum]|uniref:FtsW/RodA/SpoVE family cell cycle protein n=1 Tax=Dehalobacterium formicoaceticum TaxID=51515 RepID=UPI000B7E6C0F|nr:FtsW/RodA/SpoVE family cell cycle protein [Dehalobacterium formicoaceticum]